MYLSSTPRTVKVPRKTTPLSSPQVLSPSSPVLFSLPSYPGPQSPVTFLPLSPNPVFFRTWGWIPVDSCD